MTSTCTLTKAYAIDLTYTGVCPDRCLLRAGPTDADPPQRHVPVDRWVRLTDRAVSNTDPAVLCKVDTMKCIGCLDPTGSVVNADGGLLRHTKQT